MVGSFSACNDDNIFEEAGKECFIMCTDNLDCPKVVGHATEITWKSRISNDTIYFKVSPSIDITTELDSVCPKFYLSKGATITPNPAIPVDLTVEGGVKYTVTSEDGKTSRTYVCTYGPTDILPFGDGATLGQKVNEKLFTDLGYPGEFQNYNLADSRLYGDLNGYVAYCGHDHVVLLARQYGDPHFDNPAMATQDLSLAARVYSAADFSFVGNLNVGSLDFKNIRAITSDWNGVLCASVAKGNGSEVYKWTSYSSEPVLVASLEDNICSAADGSNYLQVSGDINGTANIAGAAPRSTKGEHYMIHLENGQVTATKKLSTGYRSDDCGGFQMISPMTAEQNPDYLVADNEGTAGEGNSVHCYINNSKNTSIVIMPACLNGDYHPWWTGTGIALMRTGARRPFASAMPINGKPYVMMLNGTSWWYCNVIVDAANIHDRITGAEVDFSTNCNWSFGGSGDWYWDEEKREANWVGYADRYGMYNVKVTCYE